jgi:hypothetical protein
MAALIRFGATPQSRDTVSEENRSRGIDLIKSSPSTLKVHGIRHYDHPAYQRYVTNIARGIETVCTGAATKILPSGSYYYYDGRFGLPKFYEDPTLIWQYEVNDASTLDALVREFGGAETTSRGKPAFKGVQTGSQIQKMLEGNRVTESTTSSVDCLNLQAITVYRRIMSIAHIALLVHQYPLLSEDVQPTFHKGWVKFEAWDSQLAVPGKTDVRIPTHCSN